MEKPCRDPVSKAVLAYLKHPNLGAHGRQLIIILTGIWVRVNQVPYLPNGLVMKGGHVITCFPGTIACLCGSLHLNKRFFFIIFISYVFFIGIMLMELVRRGYILPLAVVYKGNYFINRKLIIGQLWIQY